MVKKIKLKTKKNSLSVSSFLNKIEKESLKKDCKTLLRIFKDSSKMPAKMWGDSIVGFGEYSYKRSNGDEGVILATGFSPRKSGPVLYILPGYQDYSKILKNLGPHKLGKSCLYLKNLNDIDLTILKKLIQQGLKDLKKSHPTNY